MAIASIQIVQRTWLRKSAERAQKAELAPAIGHRHRERVDDAEHGHEDRNRRSAPRSS